MARVLLGRMLVDEGRISEVQLRSAITHQSRWGGRIGEALVHMGYVTERVMLQALSRQLGVPLVEIGPRQIPPAVFRLVPERLIRGRQIFPISLVTTRRGPLVVAISEPANLAVLDEVAFATNMSVRPALASAADIAQTIARHLDGQRPEEPPQAVDVPPDPGPMRLVNWKQ